MTTTLPAITAFTTLTAFAAGEFAQALVGMRSTPTDLALEPSAPTGKPGFDPEYIGVWPRAVVVRVESGAGSDPETVQITPFGRIIHAEPNAAVLTPTKAPAARPQIGLLRALVALAHLIPTQPTTEQWQAVKQAILDLAEVK